MAGPNDEDDGGSFPEMDSDLSMDLREALDKLTGDGDDDDGSGGFEIPLDEGAIEKRAITSEEDGIRRVQDAKSPEARLKAKADDPTPVPPPAKDEVAKPVVAEEPGKVAEAEPVKPADDAAFTAALATLAPEVQARITNERAEYAAVMAPFKGREKELEHLGVAPKDAVKRFVELNDYALRDPGGYAGWVLGQMAGGDPAKAQAALEKAAGALGYKVSKVEAPAEEEDPFMSDRERALLKENRDLKAAQTRTLPVVGPDTPEEMGRRAVMNVISEVDASGQPLRPHFQTLQPMIVAMIKAEVARTGKPMSEQGLKDAYEAAELAHPDTRDSARQRIIAAQAKNPVPQPPDTAANLAKAKAASSKIIDGPGQGASRQAAGDDDSDLSLEQLLRKNWKAGVGG